MFILSSLICLNLVLLMHREHLMLLIISLDLFPTLNHHHILNLPWLMVNPKGGTSSTYTYSPSWPFTCEFLPMYKHIICISPFTSIEARENYCSSWLSNFFRESLLSIMHYPMLQPHQHHHLNFPLVCYHSDFPWSCWEEEMGPR